MREIYVAGGCFWGVEELMRSVPGVISATTGYANGFSSAAPSYAEVCSGRTGFAETVRVVYDPARVSLAALVFLFFRAIDPADASGQGNDRGTQYRPGIYFTDEESAAVVRGVAEVERRRSAGFVVEVLPLRNFFRLFRRRRGISGFWSGILEGTVISGGSCLPRHGVCGWIRDGMSGRVMRSFRGCWRRRCFR